MHDMKRLALLVKELEDQLIVCMRCGMCQAVCPLFAETGREADVARGKLALLDGLAQEMFQDPQGVNERLMRCLLCGACAASCPSGVQVLDIFIKARAILAGYMGLHPLKKAVFRGVLAHPEFFDRLLEWAAKLQRIFVKPVDDLLGTSCARFVSPLAERHVKMLAEIPFHRRVESMNTEAGASGLKVGMFVGCLIDKIFPHIMQSALASLKHHQVGIFLPGEQGCCGIPALSSGDRDAFSRLVRHNLARFATEKFDFLVTACATCTSTIKKLWPTLAQLTNAEQGLVEELAGKTVDISQLLVDQLGVTAASTAASPNAVAVTYHDPCHLKTSLGVAAQPRTLIRANAHYRFKEMQESDWCCGCGGSFNLQHYDISRAIGRRKRENIAQSGCSVVATGCPACMLQLLDMQSQAGDRITVKHAIEIYAESFASP